MEKSSATLSSIQTLRFSPIPIGTKNTKTILIFLIIVMFSPLHFAQQNHQTGTEDNYTKVKLIQGVPASLEKIKSFSPKSNISYAITYTSQKDSVYFISRKTEDGSNNYYLVLTSDGIMRNYAALNFEKAGDDKLFGIATVKTPDGGSFTDEIYYSADDNIILYKQTIESNPETSFSKFISKNHIDFELTLGDEVIVMFANMYNYSLNSTKNTVESIALPINFHLSAGLRFLKYYKIFFRFGILYVYQDFNGIDNGIFLQADLLNTNFYGTAGIDFFYDKGTSNRPAYNGGEYTLYCFGLGYEFSKKFNADIIYCIPNKKMYGYDYDPSFDQKYDKVDNGLIKLGFLYSFIL